MMIIIITIGLDSNYPHYDDHHFIIITTKTIIIIMVTIIPLSRSQFP